MIVCSFNYSTFYIRYRTTIFPSPTNFLLLVSQLTARAAEDKYFRDQTSPQRFSLHSPARSAFRQNGLKRDRAFLQSLLGKKKVKGNC